jgi:hypothetical protein
VYIYAIDWIWDEENFASINAEDRIKRIMKLFKMKNPLYRLDFSIKLWKERERTCYRKLIKTDEMTNSKFQSTY